jgi:hypothetical protein
VLARFMSSASPAFAGSPNPLPLARQGSHPFNIRLRSSPCLTPFLNGGGSRIRTHVPDLREAVFKTAALNHSAIPPHRKSISQSQTPHSFGLRPWE